MNKSDATLGYDWSAREGFSLRGILIPTACGKTFSKGRAAGMSGPPAWKVPGESRSDTGCILHGDNAGTTRHAANNSPGYRYLLPLELESHGALK